MRLLNCANGETQHGQYRAKLFNSIEYVGETWFKERFYVIKREGVTTIESYKSIRAICNSGVENKVNLHEASRVV